MIDHIEATAFGMPVYAVKKNEIDVVNSIAFLVSIDEIQRRTTNALNRRQSQLHRAGRDFDRLRAMLQRSGVGVMCVFDPKRHAAGTRAVLLGEVGCLTIRISIEYEIYVALTVKRDIL